jgi:hypothetical protein
MIKDFLNIKKKKRTIPAPTKETTSKHVSTQRFNDMIEYYTAELKSRLTEIESLKKENEMLIKTSIKSAANADEARLHVKKLQEEIRILKSE